MDLPESEGRLPRLAKKLPGETVAGISVFSRTGLTELSAAFTKLVLL
jgi:hypothetical protein